MLSQALNSHPLILCFGELFNLLHGYVDFGVSGYNNSNPGDLKLRNTDPIGFLQERIYCQPPETTSAVGFKLHYVHCNPPWGLPAVLDYCVQDKSIRIIHLKRRNMLKSLVSEKLLVRAWENLPIPMVTRLSSIPKAFIHPGRALERARVIVRQKLRRGRLPERVAPSVEECRAYFEETASTAARHDELFREHDKLSLFYEEILSSRDEAFAKAQSFLGVEPQVLTVGLNKQNPDDLRALIENYDELREAFAGTE